MWTDKVNTEGLPILDYIIKRPLYSLVTGTMFKFDPR
jgi:hypothetical protein